MITRRNFLLTSGAVVLTGCQTPGSVNLQGPLPSPDAGKGLIVFYRPASAAGAAIRFNINHSDGYVGQLTSGAVLFRQVNPGPQTFWSQVISQDAITINVSAGQTYFVRGDVLLGVYAGRPKFTQVSPEQGRREMGLA